MTYAWYENTSGDNELTNTTTPNNGWTVVANVESATYVGTADKFYAVVITQGDDEFISKAVEAAASEPEVEEPTEPEEK